MTISTGDRRISEPSTVFAWKTRRSGTGNGGPEQPSWNPSMEPAWDQHMCDRVDQLPLFPYNRG